MSIRYNNQTVPILLILGCLPYDRSLLSCNILEPALVLFLWINEFLLVEDYLLGAALGHIRALQTLHRLHIHI